MLVPEDTFAFVDAMADILRLPDETLAMTYLYMNKYKRFYSSLSSASAPSPSIEKHDPLDSYTLSLASLSLASKSTESPRRLRDLLLPAYRLTHPPSPSPSSSSPLKVPSPLYSTLRSTLVQAEQLLLRVLGFHLRIASPLDFLPRYLDRAMADVVGVRAGGSRRDEDEEDEVAASEEYSPPDYDEWSKEAKEEYGVVSEVMETRIGRACRSRVVEACKDEGLANLFPMRALAMACVFVVLGEERGLRVKGRVEEWVQEIASGKVEMEDFWDAVAALKRLDWGEKGG